PDGRGHPHRHPGRPRLSRRRTPSSVRGTGTFPSIMGLRPLRQPTTHGSRFMSADSTATESVRAAYKVRASDLVGRNWLNTGGRQLGLGDLRGKIVILDFWTFCCINCLHVLDELRPLEAEYKDVLVTVGVHSPKFEHEADPVALAAAVERYGVH